MTRTGRCRGGGSRRRGWARSVTDTDKIMRLEALATFRNRSVLHIRKGKNVEENVIISRVPRVKLIKGKAHELILNSVAGIIVLDLVIFRAA